MPFEPNNKQGKGRKQGSTNKVNSEARQLFISIIENESSYIEEAFKQLRESSPEKYLNTLSKFTSFIIPKVSEQSFKIQSVQHEKFSIKDVFVVGKQSKELNDCE